MGIQVRYTGSVEQFQNLSAKMSSHLPYFFTFYRKYKSEKNVLIYRNRTNTQKSEDNTNLEAGNVEAKRQREEACHKFYV